MTRLASLVGRGRPAVAPLALAVVVALLALVSPVDQSHSDPGLALLVSRTLLREGTFDLASSVDDPVVARDLTGDYRLRPNPGGGWDYYAYGVPILSLPAVALAEAAGWDLRRAEDEERLQNLLSAGVCFALVLLLYRLLVPWVEPRVAWAITAVTTLGSPLISTLGTALWNSGYQLLLLTAVLILVTRSRPAPGWAVVGLLLLATVCRPTAGFLGVAVLAFWAETAPRRSTRLASGMVLAGVALGLVGAAVGADVPVARYYDPSRLFLAGNLREGLLGVLASPSRGLLVFCPFLLVVVGGLVSTGRRIWRDPVVRMVALWATLHVTAVAFKLQWWGGNSFGPRLLVEILPGVALLTALSWRELRDREARSGWRAAYLVTGLVAIAIHAGAGLFNPWTAIWNERPGINSVPESLFDWRYPQFLASESNVEARYLDLQRRRRLPYPLGEAIEPGSRYAVWPGWSPPEGDWRWTQASEADLVVGLTDLDQAAPLALLELEAGAHGHQRARLSWNGREIGELTLEGFEPQRWLVAWPGSWLRLGENVLHLELPDAAPGVDDPRRLGIALRRLRVRTLSPSFDRVGFADDAFFGPGFSSAESGWRWTDEGRATLWFPVLTLPSHPDPVLVVEAGALGRQRAEVIWDGVSLGWLEVEGFEPVEVELPIDPALLIPGRVHRIELRLPLAARVAGDERELGLAVRGLEVRARGPELD